MKMRSCLLFVVLLGMLGSPALGQVHQLSSFVQEEDMKNEFIVEIGPALPLYDFKHTETEANVPLGSKIGLGIDLSYCRYLHPYFGISMVISSNFFSYDHESAVAGFGVPMDPKSRIRHFGWHQHNFGIGVQTRIPIISKLYFTANVSARLGFFFSPSTTVEYLGDIIQGSKMKPVVLSRTEVLEIKMGAHFLMTAGIGLQYRIVKNLLVQVGADFNHVMGKRQLFTNPETLAYPTSLRGNFMNLGINVGFSYAF